MEFLSVFHHLIVFICWSISNNNDLINTLHFVDFTNFIEKNLMRLISKSSFRFNTGHKVFKILWILWKIGLLKYSIHRPYIVISVNHDLVLKGNIRFLKFNNVFSSWNRIIKDAEYCVKSSSHWASSINGNHCSYGLAFNLDIV